MEDSDHAVASQAPAQPTSEQASQERPPEVWAIDEIVDALDCNCEGALPEAALRAAQKRRDEMIPRLIELIRKATETVRSGGDLTGDGHLFALFLLTEFKAREALPAIIESLSLPDDGADKLYDDALTDLVGRLLAALSPDSTDTIDGLIADQSVDMIVRWEAADAYLHLVSDGRLTRAQAVDSLRNHLRAAISNGDGELCTALVSEFLKIGPREAIAEIQQAFDQELTDEWLFCMDDVEEALSNGDARWQKWLESRPPAGVPDTVEELSGWYYFEPDQGSDDESDEFDEPIPVSSRFLDEPFSYDHNLSDDDLLDAFDDEWVDDAPVDAPDTIRHTRPRVGRNDPCPCGSGRKFKKCCAAK